MTDDQFEEDYCETCNYFQRVHEIHPAYRFKDENGIERPAVQASGIRCTKIAPSPCLGQYWELRRKEIIYAEGA